MKTSSFEIYRDSVMRACTHVISHREPYITRERYLYDMICVFDDIRPFLEAAAEYMRRGSRFFSAGFVQSCRLLALFYEDGNEYAVKALLDMDKILTERLVKYSRNTLAFKYALLCYNELCICRVRHSWDGYSCRKNYLSILDEISHIMEENKAVSICDFQTFTKACREALNLNMPEQDALFMGGTDL